MESRKRETGGVGQAVVVLNISLRELWVMFICLSLTLTSAAPQLRVKQNEAPPETLLSFA
jgi:hypothetical protein